MKRLESVFNKAFIAIVMIVLGTSAMGASNLILFKSAKSGLVIGTNAAVKVVENTDDKLVVSGDQVKVELLVVSADGLTQEMRGTFFDKVITDNKIQVHGMQAFEAMNISVQGACMFGTDGKNNNIIVGSLAIKKDPSKLIMLVLTYPESKTELADDVLASIEYDAALIKE